MEPLIVTTANASTILRLVSLLFYNLISTTLGYQQQMSALPYPMMFQQIQQTQAQIGAMQFQAQLPQQIGDAFRNNWISTSAGPVFSSQNMAPSMSQTLYSVASQPSAVHIPVQSYREQTSVYDNSLNRTSSSTSQVHMMDLFSLNVLCTIKHI